MFSLGHGLVFLVFHGWGSFCLFGFFGFVVCLFLKGGAVLCPEISALLFKEHTYFSTTSILVKRPFCFFAGYFC